MKQQLRLVRLEIEGFRSFVKRQVIHFPEKGAVLITGKWLGSETASGTGKSTIMMAIAFVLGYCDKPLTRLRSWYSKKFYVSLVLTDGSNTYHVIRDPKLHFRINDQEEITAGAEERLTEILMTTPALAKLLTYRVQRSTGSFLNSTDSQNKENLSSVLDLAALEAAGDQAIKTTSDLTFRKTSLEGKLSGLKNSLISAVITDEEINIAQTAYNEASARMAQISTNDAQAKEVGAKLPKLLEYINKIDSAKRTKVIAETENKQLKTRAYDLKERIEKIQQAKCPTCNQTWNEFQTSLEAAQNELKLTVQSYEKNLAAIKNAQPMIDVETQIRQQITDIHSQIASLGAPMKDAANALNLATAGLQSIQNRKKYRSDLEKQIAIDETEIIAIDKRLFVMKHTAVVLGRGGFLSAIFDEVLKEIQTKANEMIANIPNISMYTLQIKSSATTQTGKVNKTINSKIYRDGIETVVDDSSGGQACGLELCTDLAYAESVRKRCSSPLGWICLDESMDGLDVGPKKAALEIIKSKVGGQIIVIDHATEVKEGFECVIEVEYDGRESHVVTKS